jgi:PilZ domain
MMQHLHEIDHRWGERFRVDIPVQVTIQAISGIDGRLKNLSLSGALLKASFDLRVHSLIEVSCVTPHSPRAYVVKAYVTRKRHQDVGIEWCEFAHPVVKDLLRAPALQMVRE